MELKRIAIVCEMSDGSIRNILLSKDEEVLMRNILFSVVGGPLRVDENKLNGIEIIERSTSPVQSETQTDK